jgi:hypothetical protein
MLRVAGKRSLDLLPVDIGSDPKSVANVDALDHQDVVLEFDFAGRLALESAFARRDVTRRFQRASEGAGQSAGGGGDDVVERGGTLGLTSCRHTIVLGDSGVDAKGDRLILCRQVCAP